MVGSVDVMSISPPPPPLLRRHSVLKMLEKNFPPSLSSMRAFYSSVLGGICVDPELFCIPVDDHMVHRGHAVFDTCNVKAGRAYGLTFHLDRLLRSAELARIHHPYSREELRDIILHTIGAAGKQEGVFVRYWLSAGRGDFRVSPEGCKPTFYVCVHDFSMKELSGVKEAITSVPLKPALLATIKSNNYMLNALSAMEAQTDLGAGRHALGIQVDGQDYVAEASIANVAIVDRCGVLRTPPFDGILAGTTAKRALVLAPGLLDAGYIEGFEMSPIHRSELATAQEVMLLGGGGCVPVIELDGQMVGGGSAGPVATALQNSLENDMLQTQKYLDRIPFEQYSLELNERNSERLKEDRDEGCSQARGLPAMQVGALVAVAALGGMILGRGLAVIR